MILTKKPKIQLSLKAKNTTIMHRGGMAGLWMSLKVLEKKYPDATQRPGNFTWDLTTTSMSLHWQGQDFPVLDWLIKESLKLDPKGLIHFTALESCSLNLINKIHIHKAINETFLRLNHFYRTREVGVESFKIKNQQIALRYKALNFYIYQDFANKLCDESGQLIDGYIKIVSWLYPGATVRHARLDKYTKIEEKAEYALALLFLPLVCQYYILQSDSIKIHEDRFAKYVIVVPEVNHLETAATRCGNFKNPEYPDLSVVNLAEAALKYHYVDTDDTSTRVRTILRNFSDRFDASPIALEVLQHWCPSELATRQNICHWHLQLSDPIYRQFSGVYLEQRRTNGQYSVDRNVVVRWIEQQLDKDWSSATTIRMATALITCATNAGLCSDKTGTRQLVYPQVTDEALTYWLYFLRNLSFAGSLWSNPYFASVGLNGRLLEKRLNRLPDFSFQSIGDVYDLDWKYEDLKAWATASLGLNLEEKA